MSEIEITQADREVAAEILKFAGMWSLALRVRAGKCDDNVTVECIARHRHEARAEALEEAAKVAERPFQPIDIGGCLIMDTDQTEIIAAAIRALRSGEREG